jgi:membrane-bound lytic murein transglycosylase D
VQKGDTLWGIARAYGVSVPQLAAANGLTTQSTISVGAKLEIPAGGSGSAAQEPARMTYKVRRGDTLSGIAGRFNVSVKELMAWNGIRRSNSLKAGQQIVLYVDPSRVNGG